MSQPSTIPQQLMTAALLHFEKGVPIDDCDIRSEQRKRLARVSHVYWIWKRNPFLEVFPMFKQLVKGKFASVQNEWAAAKADQRLFDFVVESLSSSSRKQDEEIVRLAAKQAIRIGLDTDNATALTKGGKLLYEVAHLGEPESQQADMTKVTFLAPVVTTNAHEVDDTKEDLDDQQSLAIMNKYDAYIDEKRKMIDKKVAVMEARAEAGTETEDTE